ncbi:hypothetical protein TNCV_630571 [Trichonephila clavipes]|nr:hypothetical protein TNCV_630571 [Trichonephila clavipes]
MAFGDGSRNFEPCSSDEFELAPELELPSPNYHVTPMGRRLSFDPYTAGFLWYWTRTHDTPDTNQLH